MIRIEVIGTPAPKGSPQVVMRGRGGRPLPFPRVLADSEKTKKWHKAVAAAARSEVDRGPRIFTPTQTTPPNPPFVDLPLKVWIEFRLQRPEGHFKPSRRTLKPCSCGDCLKASAPAVPAVKPDLDKLIRATMDPLEGIVYDGDSRIVEFAATKVYADMEHHAGATIVVQRWTPEPP